MKKWGFFQPTKFQKSTKNTWNGKKIAEKGGFDAKNHEESIGHDFKALSQAILAEIENLCKLPSEPHFKKGPITTL